MAKKWIVVASRVRARIYKEKPFKNVATLDNPIGREKNKELTKDQPGISKVNFTRSANAHHSLGSEYNPHDDAANEFAKTIGRYLAKKHSLHHFKEALIIAEPKMMGKIKSELEDRVKDRCEWITKDYDNLSDHELGTLLGLKRRMAA